MNSFYICQNWTIFLAKKLWRILETLEKLTFLLILSTLQQTLTKQIKVFLNFLFLFATSFWFQLKCGTLYYHHVIPLWLFIHDYHITLYNFASLRFVILMQLLLYSQQNFANYDLNFYFRNLIINLAYLKFLEVAWFLIQ